MRYTIVNIVGLASVATAQMFTNSSMTTPSATSSATSSPTATPILPGSIGAFEAFGCVRASDALSSFALTASDPAMDLNVCAAACDGRDSFGVNAE